MAGVVAGAAVVCVVVMNPAGVVDPTGAVNSARVVEPAVTTSQSRDAVPGSRGGSAAVAAEPPWLWPLTPPRIVQTYAAPPSPYAAGHRGIDIAASAGAVVAAPADATVHFVGVVVDRPVLTLDHGSGVLSSYEPLVVDGLRVGDPVARGAVLGSVGTGAHCSGVCLHVGVRIDGAYVSPLLFFDRVPRSVLLPLRGG